MTYRRCTRRMSLLAVPLFVGYATAAPVSQGDAFLRGVALGINNRLSKKTLRQRLREIKKLGANAVSVTPVWTTPHARSTAIAADPEVGPDDQLALRMLSGIRSIGLAAILFPKLKVKRVRPLEWRGTLKPTSWDTWWLSYARFILHYARLARDTDAAVLVIGSELVSTEGMRTRWSWLISRVRKVYKGKLMYSAAWDHASGVTFWDLVDIVGVTGYHQLTLSPSATEQELHQRWCKITEQLAQWSRHLGRRFVLSEIGYSSTDGAAIYPWDHNRFGSIDLEEQRRAFFAFKRCYAPGEPGADRLAGAVIWNWQGKGGASDRGYSIRDKPAQRVVADFFRLHRHSPGPGTPRR